MNIYGNNILLRACEASDYVLYREIYSSREITDLLYYKYHIDEEISTEKWHESILENRCSILLTIETFHFVPIGFLHIINLDWKNGSVGFDFSADPKNTDKSFMTSALSAASGYFFCQMRMETIIVYCLEEDNIKKEILEQTGFRKDAILNSRIMRNGERPKVALYTLLPDDLK